MTHRTPGLRLLFGVSLSALIASCTSQPPDLAKATLPGIRFEPAPGWTIYAADNGIVRLRKSNAEAIVDLAAHPPGSFESLVQQYSHVSVPSEVTEDTAIEIDGATARRISFAGKRPDTGEPNAGMRYLVPRRSHAYVFEYLDAGPQIETNRKEAQGMIEGIRFEK